MPAFPVRALAERGMILDQPDFELGPNAFSGGSNVRFSDGAVRRSSALRTVRTFTAGARAFAGFSQSGGFDRLFVGMDDGNISEVDSASVLTSRSVAGLVPAADVRQWTYDTLGDVIYMNKVTHVPQYFLGGAATQFVVLPGWDSTHRAAAIAASRDQVFAVNITKGVSTFPNTVKISDYALYGSPPATWDPLAAGVANEITLAGARSPLVGCRDLDGVMIVYAERQCWRFTFTGDTSNSAQNLWVNEPLSLDKGLISPNAAAYYERRHYAMGVDDIWTHDGTSTASIADEKVRRWVFRNLDASKAFRCFSAVDPNTGEIIFAFPSKDPDARFTATVGCNRAAIYRPRGGTWTLIDLPDCTGAGQANFNPSLTWTTVVPTWVTMGGTWADLDDGFARSLAVLSALGATKNILAVDEATNGRVPFPADAATNLSAYVIRTGYDLDELAAGLSLYKIVSTIIPQIAVMDPTAFPRFRLGTSLYPRGPYTWGEWKTFDPVTDHRVDFNKGGRYLGIHLELDEPVDFEWSGFDAEIIPGGNR